MNMCCGAWAVDVYRSTYSSLLIEGQSFNILTKQELPWEYPLDRLNILERYSVRSVKVSFLVSRFIHAGFPHGSDCSKEDSRRNVIESFITKATENIYLRDKGDICAARCYDVTLVCLQFWLNYIKQVHFINTGRWCWDTRGDTDGLFCAFWSTQDVFTLLFIPSDFRPSSRWT